MSLFPPTPKLGMVTRLLLTCFFLLLFPYSSFADFSGQVVSVLAGVLSKSSRKKGLVETPGAKACTQNLQYAFSREMKAAITHYDRDYQDMAFYHLARAYPGPIVYIRRWMLKVGWNHRDPITITGQVGRILGALIFSRIRGVIGEYW